MILEANNRMSKTNQQVFLHKNSYCALSSLPGGCLSQNYTANPKKNFKNLEAQGAEHLRYDSQMPSFFRIMDNPNYRNIKHVDLDGKPLNMMQIVSKN